MLSAILLYIFCKKTPLSAEFALELILWLGYISYFISFKILESDLPNRINSKTKLVLKLSAMGFAIAILGMNMGFAVPKLNPLIISENKVVFLLVSAIIFIVATIVVIIFFRKILEEDKKLKALNYKHNKEI